MPNVNDDILQEHINALIFFNDQQDKGWNPAPLLLAATNYFYNRMQVAEQAARNLAEALKKPPLTEEEKFQEGYIACVKDYEGSLPNGTLERLTSRWPVDSWAGRRKA